MKNLIKPIFLIALSGVVVFSSCKKSEDDPAPDGGDGFLPGAKVSVLQGNINANRTLYKDTTYILKGKVYVQGGKTLTIKPGTVIKGQKSTQGALIINRDARLVAEGTASSPIVFTSDAPIGFRNRGDWGGVIILGRGKQNKTISSPQNVTIEGISGTPGSENGVYGAGSGTENDANNAASLKFVRIEFAGIPLSDDNELNSLTLGGVGSGSTFENIMVSYANDDAIECFGGSANFKYVVILSTNDDDLDTDQGYTGAMQYGLVIRDKGVADISGSRVWESSSNSSGTDPDSKPLFANFTVFGPLMYANNTASAQISGNYRAAIEINSSSNVEIHNSVVLGFGDQINVSSPGASAVVKNTLFGYDSGSDFALGVASGLSAVTLSDLYGSSLASFSLSANGTTAAGTPTNNSSLKTNSIVGMVAPVPVLAGASSYASGAATVSSVSSFFTNEAYYGAFGTSANADWNWTSGWLEWDAANKNY